MKEAEGQFRLRILRPAGDGSYVAVGTSPTETPLGPGTEKFPAALPIQAGDLIGLDNGTTSAKVGEALGGDVGDAQMADFFPPGARGNSTAMSDEEVMYLNTESAFNADVESTPVGPPAPPPPPAPAPAPIVAPQPARSRTSRAGS